MGNSLSNSTNEIPEKVTVLKQYKVSLVNIPEQFVRSIKIHSRYIPDELECKKCNIYEKSFEWVGDSGRILFLLPPDLARVQNNDWFYNSDAMLIWIHDDADFTCLPRGHHDQKTIVVLDSVDKDRATRILDNCPQVKSIDNDENLVENILSILQQ